MMLMLIDTIVGRARAEAVARDLGVKAWDARHACGAFRFTRPFTTTVLANCIASWNYEHFSIHLDPGMDEVSLTLMDDAWSRTNRARALAYATMADAPIKLVIGRSPFPAGTGVNASLVLIVAA